MIEVHIPLFGLASIELPIAGEEITQPAVFTAKGDELRERLHHVATTVTTLLSHHWTIIGELFSLVAYHDQVHTVVDAITTLDSLGIDLDGLTILDADEIDDDLFPPTEPCSYEN